jgi:predicted amidohydrolase
MGTIRLGSANFGTTLKNSLVVDYTLESAPDVLAAVERTLDVLEGIVHKAGDAGCDVVAFPESTLALTRWERTHPTRLAEVLPVAVERMLERLGQAASSHSMHLVCCNDSLQANGAMRNTAFLLGPDGREIGRYHKVMLPLHEQLKEPGEGFPVFDTPELGPVGILICYDMVFPEPARCLALGGAGIIFVPTEGGAAFGGLDISLAAFRTRAVENFCYLVVSWGAGRPEPGSIIISPQGEIIAQEKEPGEVAVAEVDPFGGRQGGDFANWQEDLRCRVYRERRPSAYGVLTDPHPPALDRLPDYGPAPAEEIAEIFGRAITVGHVHHREAQELLRKGQIEGAIAAFEALGAAYPKTWFDREASARLKEIRARSGA